MLEWLRSWAADAAYHFALAAKLRADRNIVRAREANAASEWWHDVQLWLDGCGRWSELRRKREQRLAIRSPLMHGRAR